jgi:hypothetical protein
MSTDKPVKPRGRPLLIERGKRVVTKISIDQRTKDKLYKLGDSCVSRGVRKALALLEEQGDD